jgi:hypothetical protein
MGRAEGGALSPLARCTQSGQTMTRREVELATCEKCSAPMGSRPSSRFVVGKPGVGRDPALNSASFG